MSENKVLRLYSCGIEILRDYKSSRFIVFFSHKIKGILRFSILNLIFVYVLMYNVRMKVRLSDNKNKVIVISLYLFDFV